jgi:tetraacyldisaccharide 4'-kinase
MAGAGAARSAAAELLRGGGGAGGVLLRSALAPFSWVYAGAARGRNILYDWRALRIEDLARPAVSVGNLTAGGTGKTPFTFWLLEWARRRGLELAVLTRGYGGAGNSNDEIEMARARFPKLAIGAGADRAASARVLLATMPQIGGFVLDDGFQRRSVARNLDIVLVDATDPFGGGRCLPAGLLREPIVGIRRAAVAVLTRADLAGANAKEKIWSTLARKGYAGPRVEAEHRAAAVVPLDPRGETRSVASMRGASFRLLSAVANPGAFEATLRAAGAEVREHLCYPDHHKYHPADLPDLRGSDGASWLCTEKDAVKLRRLGAIDGHFLRIELTITSGESQLSSLLTTTLLSPPK